MRIRGDVGAESARFDPRPWRDVRFIGGIVLVLAATVLGGLALAAADRTTGFWAVRDAVHAGDPVSAADLMEVRVKASKRTERTLLRTDAPLPGRLDQLRWAAGASPGTLVTVDRFESRQGVTELPVTVALGGVPPDLRPGDHVDVWATPGERSDEPARARKVLSNVRVLSRSRAVATMSAGSGLAFVVDVSDRRLDGGLMRSIASDRLTVVRVS